MLIKRIKFIMAFIVVFSFFTLPVSAQTEDPEDPRWKKESKSIDPRGTYLRTCEDSPHNPTILDLYIDYDINILDWIVLREIGSYVPWDGGADVSRDMIAVFSSTTRLHPDSVTQKYRVPDAVSFSEFPNLAQTPGTHNECEEQAGQEAKHLETDIDEDFWICCADSAVLVHVPAQYLFVTNFTDYWADNRDPNGDYKVEFSNYIKWEQHSNNPDPSTCRDCWDQVKNWDVEAVPRSEVGVIFDTSFNSSSAKVTKANGEVKFLIIEDGMTVKFEDSIDLSASHFDAAKYSFLVDGGSMTWDGGDLETDMSYIGKEKTGSVTVEDGKWFAGDPLYVGSKSDGTLTVSTVAGDPTVYAGDVILGDAEAGSGTVTVGEHGWLEAKELIVGNNGEGSLQVSKGGNVWPEVLMVGKNTGSGGNVSVKGSTIFRHSEIDAGEIRVGFQGDGSLTISDGGQVYSQNDVNISGLNIGNATAIVSVKSGGGLGADGSIYIWKRGNLFIDGGSIAALATHVHSGGVVLGCNSGIVSSLVINQGGVVGPGCSTGTLIIDGDFIQESAGTLVIEVGGYKKGEEYDVLEVRGNATLNGTVQVNFVDGFAPKQGDVFEFTNITGSASQNLSKVETDCVADDFQYETELVGGKLTLTALNDATAIPCETASFSNAASYAVLANMYSDSAMANAVNALDDPSYYPLAALYASSAYDYAEDAYEEATAALAVAGEDSTFWGYYAPIYAKSDIDVRADAVTNINLATQYAAQGDLETAEYYLGYGNSLAATADFYNGATIWCASMEASGQSAAQQSSASSELERSANGPSTFSSAATNAVLANMNFATSVTYGVSALDDPSNIPLVQLYASTAYDYAEAAYNDAAAALAAAGQDATFWGTYAVVYAESDMNNKADALSAFDQAVQAYQAGDLATAEYYLGYGFLPACSADLYNGTTIWCASMESGGATK